jgi:hypothetical protein
MLPSSIQPMISGISVNALIIYVRRRNRASAGIKSGVRRWVRAIIAARDGNRINMK